VREGDLALFGTSADPPTQGHRTLLAGLAGHYPLVVTWASDNPLKRHAAPLTVRRALLQAVVDGLALPGLRLDQRLSHRYTLTSLEQASVLYPDHRLVVVVGSDLLPQIPGWHAAAELLRQCRLAVVPRQGFPVTEEAVARLEALGGTVEPLPLTIPDAASSRVRAHPDPELVPPELRATLQERNLYGFGARPGRRR
jgi:nicotinate-nucleotide adenylyltransferase